MAVVEVPGVPQRIAEIGSTADTCRESGQLSRVQVGNLLVSVGTGKPCVFIHTKNKCESTSSIRHVAYVCMYVFV